MSNGDDEPADGDDGSADGDTEPADGGDDLPAAEGDGEPEETADIGAFESRLEAVEEALEAAGTEADLDAVESDADGIESDLEAAEFPVPEPEDDEEDPEDPKEPLEDRLGDVRDGIEDERGPYGEDVKSEADDAAETIRNTRWTRDGTPAVAEAVASFLEAAGETLDETFAIDGDSEEGDETDTGALAEAVESVGDTAADGRLDADEDAETIAVLLDTVGDLESALEDAEEWSDLEIAEQLTREGFYDRLTPENRKDFPPELGVVRIAEAENDPDRILLAMESLDSDFMAENCLDALRRLGSEEAYEPVSALAKRRDVPAIEVLGKIGDERAVGMLVDFVDSGNPPLQKATLRALGEIGSEEASQPIANTLDDPEPAVRSAAARALGLVGDTQAIEPLSDRLDDDEESDRVRASAAWALVRIGTARALEAVAAHDDDRVYTVQLEAEKARDAIV